MGKKHKQHKKPKKLGKKGMKELEAYLAKCAEFEAYLEQTGRK